MLKKAANVLNKNGYILYMVCSFLRNETENQINKFLKENNNFENYGFPLSNKNFKHMELVKGKYLNTLPTTIKSYNIDGYFAALIKKIK